MKISIIGTGYVGLVTGTCFAEMGNNVICQDVDKDKIKNLNKGIIPIYEPELDRMIKKNVDLGTIFFTTDIQHTLDHSDICFIAVGTPMGEDGSADLSYVLDVARQIGQNMKHSLIVVDKSTVPVGTAEKVAQTIQEELNQRNLVIPFYVISNPEFLKEGAAIRDFMRPERIVIGCENPKVIDQMRELYSPFVHNHDRIIVMDTKSAELTKYAANAMLATKISFMNEIANICEKVGADVNHVRIGIGSDSRIGYDFIYPGVGYGGSCFPKDVRALEKTALDNNYTPKILNAVQLVNETQKRLLAEKVIHRFGDNLNGYSFAIWGLSFKPETDDMREAPSAVIIQELTKRGAIVKVYDPKAMDQAKKVYLKGNNLVQYYNSKYSALNEADALLLITEWKEFRSPDFEEIAKRLNQKIIFDGRNQYHREKLEEAGFEYYQIGWMTDPARYIKADLARETG